VVDLDGDGRMDVLSGSLQPGDVYLFAGQEGGAFAAGRTLVDAHGERIRVGRGSLPFAADWEGDGDLDLLIGNMKGELFLARNGSQGKALAFEAARPLDVGGVAFNLGTTNAAPCVADWDQDGRADLLLGSADGRVLFLRDGAKAGAPELATPVELVPSTSGQFHTAPAMRTKLAVVDWNADGKLDLLLGDYAPESGTAPELDPAQKKELAQAMAESLELGTRLGDLERPAFARWLSEHHVPADQGQLRHEDFLVEWKARPDVRPLQQRLDELMTIQRRLNPPLYEHGRVWLFLRR